MCYSVAEEVKTEEAVTKPVGYLPTLDGWRALAVSAVIFSHWDTTGTWLDRIPHRLLWFKSGCGEKGVQLFFAISGFLITFRLIEEWNRSGRISLKNFYIRRACRILPPAMTYLGVVAVLALLGVLAVRWSEWIAAAFFYKNYLPVGKGGFEEHYWSLSVEEQFYLVWPALLALSGLYRARYTAIGIILSVWTWRFIAYHHILGAQIGQGDWGRAEICFDGMMMGCLFALVLNSPQAKVWLTKGLSVSVVVLVALLIMATGGRSYTPLGRSIQSTLMPLLILGTVLNSQTWLGRLLEFRALRWLGRLSYSLYVWQQLFSVRGIFPWYSVQTASLLVVAGISFYCIERPMMRVGYKLAPPSTLAHKDLGVKAQ